MKTKINLREKLIKFLEGKEAKESLLGRSDTVLCKYTQVTSLYVRMHVPMHKP